MKRVLTYGTYDLLHVGHVRLLQRARALGDHLTVAISTDEFNLNMKNKVCVVPYADRKFICEALACVDLVIPETTWDQKISDVVDNKIDVFVMGSDWEGKFDFLAPHCEVVYLPRTENISSTELKQFIREDSLTEKRTLTVAS
jgi:glycerol-3-phosphate cytidylyltransferase